MKAIDTHEVKERLAALGMGLSEWGSVVSISGSEQSTWRCMSAPLDHLFRFSHHVASWLPRGTWKLVQLDNSSGWIDPAQESLLNAVFHRVGGSSDLSFNTHSSFLCDCSIDGDIPSELTIGNVIFVLLLFRLHAYVLSSGSIRGELLGIQDGSVCFSGVATAVSRAESMIRVLSDNPASYPAWILEVISERQERDLGLSKTDVE